MLKSLRIRNFKNHVDSELALCDHPNADAALRVLTTGEFWSTGAEMWPEPEA